MNVYETQMNLFTTDMAVWSKVFLTFLKEGALSSFTLLPPKSVDCFIALLAKFNTQYATSRLHHISSLDFLNSRQEKGEPLRALMERFNKLSISIRNLMAEISMHHLVSAL